MAPSPSDPAREEAALLAEAERVLASGDDNRALTLALQCLERFPQATRGLQIAAGVLVRTQRWQDLANLYEQLIAGHPDAAAVSKLCVAASRLYHTKLGKNARAVSAIERACELQPKNSELQLEAASLHETLSQLQFAENHYRTAISIDPLSERCYRRAAAFFAWSGQPDLAWNATCALSHLTQTDATESERLRAGKREGLLQPNRPLNGTDFAVGLSAAPSDPALAQLLTVMADVIRKLTLPRPKQQSQLLQKYISEDPLKSTATLARAFAWTCRLLQIPPPELYLAEGNELPTLLPVTQPAWLVGKGMGRGLSSMELVFIWARALSRLRPEAHAALYTQGAEQLATFVLASLVATGRAPASAAPSDAVRALQKQCDAGLLTLIGQRLDGFDATNARARVFAFAAQLDVVGNRLGLLASGDPSVAAAMLTRFPVGEIGTREQLADLFKYAMSQPYAELRRELGIALLQ
jgi:hypothetical protein